MLTRLSLILTYILYCIRFAVAPWRYFQLNAPYFNEQRELFSKLEMDSRIPQQWLLDQYMDLGTRDPEHFPVFVKPEWGQNSQGVVRVDSLEQLNKLRQQRTERHPFYLIQQAAQETREFELFMVPHEHDLQQFSVLSVTETCNRSGDPLPVNGIYNPNSYYESRMAQLNSDQLQAIWQHLKQMGNYRIARYGVRANSIDDLIAGQFHVVEINLYVPMPLVLLTQDMRFWEKAQFINSTMRQLVLVTQTIPNTQPIKSVFFKKLGVAQRLKSVNKSSGY